MRSRDVDAIIEDTPDARGKTFSTLRDLIHQADPNIAEAAKWKKPSDPLGSAVFEHDGIVCILIRLKGRVRLSFGDGSKLPDPKGLFNAQLNGQSRAIDFPDGGKIDAPAVKALVKAAVKLRTRSAKTREKNNAARKKPR